MTHHLRKVTLKAAAGTGWNALQDQLDTAHHAVRSLAVRPAVRSAHHPAQPRCLHHRRQSRRSVRHDLRTRRPANLLSNTRPATPHRPGGARTAPPETDASATDGTGPAGCRCSPAHPFAGPDRHPVPDPGPPPTGPDPAPAQPVSSTTARLPRCRTSRSVTGHFPHAFRAGQDRGRGAQPGPCPTDPAATCILHRGTTGNPHKGQSIMTNNTGSALDSAALRQGDHVDIHANGHTPYSGYVEDTIPELNMVWIRKLRTGGTPECSLPTSAASSAMKLDPFRHRTRPPP